MTSHLQTSPCGKSLYSPLQDPLAIRLLLLYPETEDAPIQGSFIIQTLSTSIDSHHVPQPISYSALSYCWGDDRSTHHSIEIDSHSLGVTSHLHSALRQLRKADVPTTLWIDAICINQQDIEERGRQVAIMRLSQLYLSTILHFHLHQSLPKQILTKN